MAGNTEPSGTPGASFPVERVPFWPWDPLSRKWTEEGTAWAAVSAVRWSRWDRAPAKAFRFWDPLWHEIFPPLARLPRPSAASFGSRMCLLALVSWKPWGYPLLRVA